MGERKQELQRGQGFQYIIYLFLDSFRTTKLIKHRTDQSQPMLSVKPELPQHTDEFLILHVRDT